MNFLRIIQTVHPEVIHSNSFMLFYSFTSKFIELIFHLEILHKISHNETAK